MTKRRSDWRTSRCMMRSPFELLICERNTDKAEYRTKARGKGPPKKKRTAEGMLHCYIVRLVADGLLTRDYREQEGPEEETVIQLDTRRIVDLYFYISCGIESGVSWFHYRIFASLQPASDVASLSIASVASDCQTRILTALSCS
jgi:hypothetical protein